MKPKLFLTVCAVALCAASQAQMFLTRQPGPANSIRSIDNRDCLSILDPDFGLITPALPDKLRRQALLERAPLPPQLAAFITNHFRSSFEGTVTNTIAGPTVILAIANGDGLPFTTDVYAGGALIYRGPASTNFCVASFMRFLPQGTRISLRCEPAAHVTARLLCAFPDRHP